ncbi:serine/threonine-protein kinase pim-2-like [Eucyclogobius newberryi]|uniref:serine/threonine-protein kinase pim-2-like n=1 Tax=Eucyclogobius newberryi TaxID=166745 RepID=UPI003B58EF72
MAGAQKISMHSTVSYQSALNHRTSRHIVQTEKVIQQNLTKLETMKMLQTRKRSRTSDHNNAKSPDTDICGPVEGQRLVPGKSKVEYEAEVKKAKVESSSESWTCSSEDELYDVTYQVSNSRANLNSKYRELYKLGSGGSGSVFAGLRLEDAFSVAIKYIPRKNVYYKKVVQKGVEYNLIDEVALMVKLVNCPAMVPMLDCYEFPEEVVIVMERPYPALDLLYYKDARLGELKEQDAKLILRQLLEASIQMHRDLKLENVLVELAHGFPRARVIDFGCGCLVKEGTYTDFAGPVRYASPEMYFAREYRAKPTTVYHLGTLLYDLFHHSGL